jgi:hypothetical protein
MAPNSGVLFFDDFNDGVADGWTQWLGNWYVSNQEYVASGFGNFTSTVNGLNLTDCVIETKLRFQDVQVSYTAGIIFRYVGGQTPRSYYSFDLGKGYNKAEFIYHDLEEGGGTGWNYLASVDYPVESNVNYILKVEVNKNTFTCYVNGTEVFVVTDGHLTVGKLGLNAHPWDSPATALFDDFKVWVRVPTYIDLASPDWAFIGFAVGVSGRLTDMDGNYLRNENVTLQRFMGGNTWAVLAWDITDEFGNYLTDWEPATVGTYVVKVNWSGNQTFFPAESTNKTIIIRSIPTRISLALSSSTSLIGFQVAISGDLISDIRAVSNAPVFLSYSVTGGQTWNDVTQVYTASDGRFSATWLPTATGNYIVKASWAGNYMYPKASVTVNLAVIPFEEKNVFSVISNSTVTGLSFESTHRELTFTVEGYPDTMGYADVYIAKTLIGNIEEVEVKLNGTEIDYTATSVDDSWLIHFTYQHSAHIVAVNLGFETEAVDGGLPLLLYFIAGAAVVVVVVIGIALMKRRRQRLTR